MYSEHQPQLSRLGRSGPDGLIRICTFALLTIRVHLHAAVSDYPIVRGGNRKVRSVWGWKHTGLDELDERGADIFEMCERQYHDTEGEELEDGLLHTLTSITGLGCAKAGFVAQMVYGVSGCLDGHNLTRFGIPDTTFKIAGHTNRRRSSLISLYNQTCRKFGGTRELWDSWCTYLAERDANYAGNPDYVSRLHLTPLSA